MIQYSWLAHFVILSWLLFRILRWVLPDRMAIGVAFVVTLLLSMIDNVFMLYFVALLDPLGLLLPLLALRNIADLLTTIAWPRITLYELLAWLVAGVVFIASALGVFAFDLYAVGYNDPAVVIIATTTSLYFAWRKQGLFLAISVLGYILWSFDFGSSNYFDYVFHALMVPVLAIQLMYRLIGLAKGKDKTADSAQDER
jgi:hypothetical protein